MSDQQLWLFEQPKPLRERFGDAFFRQVPPLPGIYLMRDGRERVLYVGQSSNLRQRLNTYKNIRPGTHARKLVRLASATEQIVWETCDSPGLARLRENVLLRHYRPKFNRVNTHPEAYGYIGFRASDNALELWLTNRVDSSPDLFGAFKGQRRAACHALLHLLRQVSEPERPPWDNAFAAGDGVGAAAPLQRKTANCPWETLIATTRRYLSGDSNELLDALRAWLPPLHTLPIFWQRVQALQLDTLAQFYEHGPERNTRLRTVFAIPSRLIAPAALDDLLVRLRDQEEEQ